MELDVTISGLGPLVIALASIGGGLVLTDHQSRRAGWGAVGMSAVRAWRGVLLVLALTLPAFQSSEGQAPEPVIVRGLVPTQSTEVTAAPPASDLPAASGMMVPRS